MVSSAAQRMYVIAAASLLAVLEFDRGRVRQVLSGLVGLAGTGRMKTIALEWKIVRNTVLGAAFVVCVDDFVVKEVELGPEMRQVFRTCGNAIVRSDATEDDPEVWLLALALKTGATIISEASVLSNLPGACVQLGVPLEPLARLLSIESI